MPMAKHAATAFYPGYKCGHGMFMLRIKMLPWDENSNA